MKRIFVVAAFAMAFAMTAVGCAGDTADQGQTGTVGLNVIIDGVDVTSVAFEVVCDSGVTLNGNLNVNDENDPPIATTIMDLPPGPCSVSLAASNEQGEVLCTGSTDFTVIVDQTVEANVVLLCGEPGVDPVGNVNITGTFEFVPGNRCPRLYFLNAVPDEVPAEGSEVTVLVEDADGDVLTTALTATGGSFADPAAQLTTYFCDNASGGQTISVTVTDGDAACDKSKSFDVTCPGVNLCEGVTCDDTGNECTTAECNPETGLCEESDLDGNECTAGGGGELANNGGFEDGNLDGWTLFCDGPNNGTCEATTAEANTGSWSGRVATAGAPANPLIKQANLAIGVVQPNSEITIRFSMKGSAGPGGVVFAELFSEIIPEGATNEILGGALIPTDQWVPYEFITTTGPDVSNGVTLQLAAVCGAVAGCTVEVFFDDVSIVIPGGGGEPGTCDAGVCVPNPECTVPADCPDTGNECIDAVCDAGTCGTSNNTDACDGGAGTCDGQGNCVPNAECVVNADCPDTGNECIDAVCNAGTCETANNTDPCDGGAGTCNAGVCEPNAEVVYEQDFEGLDQASGTALGTAPGGAGFLVFGNEFLPDGTPIQGYGPFPAPNGTPGFCSIALDQGGPEQGAQQLVIYSDYNNGANQEAGNLVEANTFQEPFSNPDSLITAADLGTYTFSFDAKRGDINDPNLPRCDPASADYTPNPPCDSTAVAFIKTLDPSAGFATTNNITLNTTALPVEWNRYSIQIVVDAALIGQVMQFGFAATATNFEPSGVFYDNILITVE